MRSPRLQQLIPALLVCAIAGTAFAGLTGPKGENNDEKRAAIRKERDEILAKLYKAHPEAKAKIEKAPGYATFNNKNLKIILLSAGAGYGMVVDNHSGKETFM